MTGVFDHPWLGALFGDPEIAALWSPQTQLNHMLRFEAAWSRALGHVGRIDAGTAEETARHILGITPDLTALATGTARDGLPIPALVSLLKATAPDPTAVHQGATSQDVLDTALALTLQATTTLLDQRLTALQSALETLDHRFGANPLMGRTRMQAAMPIRVRDRLRPWITPLAAHRTRLARATDGVALLQFGGAVGDRAAMGTDAPRIAAHLANALGLGNPPACWHATREGLAEYASTLSLISGTLAKLGQDVALMAQQGFDEIHLTGTGTSSAMPHKQNPILAELLVTLGRFNAVQVSALHHAVIHEQERSGTAWALEWMVLPHMAQATGRALTAASELCHAVTHIGLRTAPPPET
ncbi:MAG: 3-carboxy-cis,cis-muconate cycloisomerase [Roseovarius sp.]|uniref:3-carboxy-cis,cis-muconate cycloisomerase n=1 Tax=Roseovarius sp. TaxID=1486281 RepID=UPI001B4344F2|nr:3-carboxy-cis,cis-muconate cycloisomerase [Roseovarius sp.]MBQ0750031.1 3-carboxy-cis,cis-muconate cycloisomerase [Roseovarius sp.]MBQ0810606.1 3-carboxy-cis,cis-muconate cycloisomerase [Roseovarius sp.]